MRRKRQHHLFDSRAERSVGGSTHVCDDIGEQPRWQHLLALALDSYLDADAAIVALTHVEPPAGQRLLHIWIGEATAEHREQVGHCVARVAGCLRFGRVTNERLHLRKRDDRRRCARTLLISDAFQ
mmetsp:Transcript_55275/g.127084  ORF Transcript_55275/g.127084 Transcript_55275/m.127084 type:complete len:126 (+) Transcript_55275:862-1239(+)